MLVFVDESGDSGFKTEHGSSQFFTVALVIFEEHDEATACDQRIQLLKREMKMPPLFEFKFSRLRREQREGFFEAVLPYSFFYFGIIINKDHNKLYGRGFKIKESFYKYACSLVFENAKPYLREATVVIDGSGSREFKRELSAYLRRKIGVHAIKKVKIQQSHSNNLLQLADMVAGTIQRSLSQKNDKHIYRRLIGAKEMYVQMWPR